MKYATLDKSGIPTSFYDIDIHGSDIPSGAIEIPEADYQAHLSGDFRKYDGTAWVKYTPPPVKLTYQQQRAAALPSLAEQLDMQYWDNVNGTTLWQDMIAAVKLKYPKV